MRRLLAPALMFLLPALSFAQAGPVPGGSGGGSSTITSGTTATSGCVAGGVLRSISNLVECGAGLTYTSTTALASNSGFVSTVTQSNTPYYGGTPNATADFVGVDGYWALRTGTSGQFNLDIYRGVGTQFTPFSVAQTGAITISGFTGTAVPLTINNGTSTGSSLVVQDNGNTSFEVRDGSTVQIGGTTSDRYMLMTGLGGASGYQGTISYPTDFVIGYGANTITPTATLKLPGYSSNNAYLYGGQSMTGAVVQVGGGSNNGLGANIFAGTEYALTSGTATEVVTISLAAGLATGGNITYTVFASDGTDMQARSGEIRFALVNKAGTETCAVYGVDNAATVNPDQTQDGSSAGAFSAGTLTYVWSVDTSGSNSCVLKLAATSSLGAPPTVLRMNFNAHLKGPGTMTLSST